MRKAAHFGLAFLALVAGTGSAWAFQVPDPNAPYVTEHQMAVRQAENQPQPWAMTYSDQAAKRLGVENGQWKAFSTPDDSRFSLNGGVNSQGAVLRLTW